MSCAVCGAAARTKLHVEDVPILACPECGLAFWEPPAGFRPEATYDGAYFADPGAAHGYDDYGSLEASLRATFAARLARLPPPEPGARLLDVGAAYGFALAEARRGGWRACGVEIARPAAQRAAAQGPVVVASALATPFRAGSFAAVTLWDVLEHLPDPHAAFAEAARLLRPGGTLALTTGDVGSALARLSGRRWHLYTLPEHLFFFTRESLGRLLDAHGFALRAMRAEGAVFTLGYLAERLRKTLLRRPARRPARFPGAGWRVRVNLFDVLALEAVRRESAP